MVFRVGDLVRVKKDSWWLKRSQTFRAMIAPDSLVSVTDDLISSEKFFYGVVCGGNDEAHLWSQDQFDLVQKVKR